MKALWAVKKQKANKFFLGVYTEPRNKFASAATLQLDQLQQLVSRDVYFILKEMDIGDTVNISINLDEKNIIKDK